MKPWAWIFTNTGAKAHVVWEFEDRNGFRGATIACRGGWYPLAADEPMTIETVAAEGYVCCATCTRRLEYRADWYENILRAARFTIEQARRA